MFQCKIDKIFSDMPYISSITDDILVIGYNENRADHDAAVHKVLWRCKEVNLKLNKEKCHFRCTSIPFFGEVILRKGVQPDLQKIKALPDIPTPNNKKELQAFLSIINSLGKFSPGTAENVWTPCASWLPAKQYGHRMHLTSHYLPKAKLLINSDMCMKFYDTKLLYIETDASRVGLGAALLQMWEETTCQKDMVPNNKILHPIAFASKCLTGAEHRYSNMEREALGILHGLKKFHHYCFAKEVHIIIDHKPLVAIFKKDVAMLSQCIQHILLNIHQYRVQILYKPGPEIFIARLAVTTQPPRRQRWTHLRHGHKGGCHTKCNRHPRVHNHITGSTGNGTGWTSPMSKNIIITGWLSTKDQLHIDIRPYWSYRDNLAVIEGVVIKGRCIIVPWDLQQQVLDQLHLNHMGIKNKITLMRISLQGQY